MIAKLIFFGFFGSIICFADCCELRVSCSIIGAEESALGGHEAAKRKGNLIRKSFFLSLLAALGVCSFVGPVMNID